MSESALRIVPGTADRLDDVMDILGVDGGHGCLCQYWRFTSGEYSRSTGATRREALGRQLGERPPAGMIAYRGDEPVGWVGFGIRSSMGRLVRSRTIPRVDDVPVWAVFCFTVRVGHRRAGVARALLDGLVDYARREGAPALEAYPVETDGARIHGSAAYHGVASMFLRAGFRRVAATDARADHLPRTVMRLDL